MRIDVAGPVSVGEASAIRLAIETLLKRAPASEPRPSAWEATARREALDDRVH
ncbi:MAG TPA: hypothetical protein VKT51_05250 [Candidatus Eremiobacteraceae bacterium]|nr:hypothetical protein [Candidatus Eremiobacteraceae bacterium]